MPRLLKENKAEVLFSELPGLQTSRYDLPDPSHGVEFDCLCDLIIRTSMFTIAFLSRNFFESGTSGYLHHIALNTEE